MAVASKDVDVDAERRELRDARGPVLPEVGAIIDD